MLFSGAVESACGFAQAAMGPFYCPADRQVYIDLDFYRDLKDKLGAPGDFAQAYVIAHEVGHHVQNLLGISDKVHQMQGKVTIRQYNHLSVRLELQADCLAGRMGAPRGPDPEYYRGRGYRGSAQRCQHDRGRSPAETGPWLRITPDSFTHGSSAQRVRWFRKGLQSGAFEACDTFAVANP